MTDIYCSLYFKLSCYISADGDFISERKTVKIHPGMIVIIPKETFHSFAIKDQNKYTRYCLNFTRIEGCCELIDLCMDNIYILDNPHNNITRIFEDLANTFKREFTQNERELMLIAAYVRLMLELKLNMKKFTISDSRDESSVIYRALIYINKNYCSDISIDELSKNLNVSKSFLSHEFKRELNIPIYRYIVDKRLLYARQRIQNGTPAAEACSVCGFHDYSVFYRAYIKRYGASPSTVRNLNNSVE